MTDDPGAKYIYPRGATGWLENAACGGVDVNIFYPTEPKGPREPRDKYHALTELAKTFCHGCPVQAECLQYALDTNDKDGVLGGTTPAERKKMSKTQRPFHGTRNGYGYHKCRCPACTSANTEHSRRREGAA